MKIFKKKSKIDYGPFLQQCTDVMGKKPALVKALAEDIDLELYLGKCGTPNYSWATAVVSVKKKDGRILKSKYDGGRIKGNKDTLGFRLDLSQMALECIHHIKHSWGLDHFRSLL